VNLLLDPGLAFEREPRTTRLCLRWLERRIAGGGTVLDYGLRFRYIGNRRVEARPARAMGVDIDQDAVAAAAANARRNGVAGEFFESGSLPALALTSSSPISRESAECSLRRSSGGDAGPADASHSRGSSRAERRVASAYARDRFRGARGRRGVGMPLRVRQ